MGRWWNCLKVSICWPAVRLILKEQQVLTGGHNKVGGGVERRSANCQRVDFRPCPLSNNFWFGSWQEGNDWSFPVPIVLSETWIDHILKRKRGRGEHFQPAYYLGIDRERGSLTSDVICASCGVLLRSNVGATGFENNEHEEVVTYEAFFMTVTIRVYTARPETQWANMKCKNFKSNQISLLV